MVGGGELAGRFLDEDLLDELIVSVTPVLLGRGADQHEGRLDQHE